MKTKIKITVLFAFLAMMTLTAIGQSKSDVCDGSFTLPSYEEKYGGWKSDGVDGYCTYEFSDGTKGILYKNKKCSHYSISWDGVHVYYKNLDAALKALYAYKKYGCIRHDEVSCND
jgi:hypothetical protein